jgi:hypothetical protein
MPSIAAIDAEQGAGSGKQRAEQFRILDFGLRIDESGEQGAGSGEAEIETLRLADFGLRIDGSSIHPASREPTARRLATGGGSSVESIGLVLCQS